VAVIHRNAHTTIVCIFEILHGTQAHRRAEPYIVTRGSIRLVRPQFPGFGKDEPDNVLDLAGLHCFPFGDRHPVAIPLKNHSNVFTMHLLPNRAAGAQ
jgi:hypothetical protein